MRLLVFVLSAVLFSGCAALRDDLRRAETAFTEARYDDAKVWLDDLESSVPQMDRELRARFYYLAGMTAYRIGDRARARHYLALCREEAGDVGVGLTAEWRTNLSAALLELGGRRNELEDV